MIVVLILFTTAAVLIPLFIAGVIPISKKQGDKRLTYDPYYYGNLHPYLYPTERSSLGINTDYDVIVVGAGISGLATAQAVRRLGLSVVVLEARVCFFVYIRYFVDRFRVSLNRIHDNNHNRTRLEVES